MSKTLIVRYQTHPDAAEANAELIREVFAGLGEVDAGGLRYSVFRLADGVTFVHVAHLDGPENPLAQLPAFAEFQRDLPQRCVEQPAASEAAVVGSYG
ncbi:MAG: hypothetical protein NTZ03_10055 [Actinobacteria bacterium]|nr:hypothetical protein [Actinomycetota bacterium]